MWFFTLFGDFKKKNNKMYTHKKNENKIAKK